MFRIESPLLVKKIADLSLETQDTVALKRSATTQCVAGHLQSFVAHRLSGKVAGM
jgi:hypothetical protein